MFLHLFLYEIIATNAKKLAKGRYNAICIYYGGEWPNKFQLSKHHHKGCINSPFYLDSTKHVQLPVYPNFKAPWESKMLKQMLVDGKGSMDLPLKTQLGVDQEHDQIISVGHKVVKQVCWFKTLVRLCPTTKYNAHHRKCKWDDDVMEKHSETSQKIKRPELVIVEEIIQKHTHCTKR
jgi:hypothetical protein